MDRPAMGLCRSLRSIGDPRYNRLDPSSEKGQSALRDFINAAMRHAGYQVIEKNGSLIEDLLSAWTGPPSDRP